MKNLYKFIFISLLLILNFSCISSGNNSTSEEGATSITATSIEVFGRWPTSSLPLNITFSSDFSASEISQMKSYGATWETVNSSGMDIVNFSNSTVTNKDYSNLNSYFDGSIEIHQINTTTLDADALAITVYAGNVMNQGTTAEYLSLSAADILFNYYDMSFSLAPGPGAFDLSSVFVHEMGHVFGLNHVAQSSAISVMNPTLASQEIHRNLSTRDISNINSIYNNSLSNTLLARTSGTTLPDIPGDYIEGYIKLSKDLKCTHVVNGKIVEIHQYEK